LAIIISKHVWHKLITGGEMFKRIITYFLLSISLISLYSLELIDEDNRVISTYVKPISNNEFVTGTITYHDNNMHLKVEKRDCSNAVIYENETEIDPDYGIEVINIVKQASGEYLVIVKHGLVLVSETEVYKYSSSLELLTIHAGVGTIERSFVKDDMIYLLRSTQQLTLYNYNDWEQTVNISFSTGILKLDGRFIDDKFYLWNKNEILLVDSDFNTSFVELNIGENSYIADIEQSEDYIKVLYTTYENNTRGVECAICNEAIEIVDTVTVPTEAIINYQWSSLEASIYDNTIILATCDEIYKYVLGNESLEVIDLTFSKVRFADSNMIVVERRYEDASTELQIVDYENNIIASRELGEYYFDSYAFVDDDDNFQAFVYNNVGYTYEYGVNFGCNKSSLLLIDNNESFNENNYINQEDLRSVDNKLCETKVNGVHYATSLERFDSYGLQASIINLETKEKSKRLLYAEEDNEWYDFKFETISDEEVLYAYVLKDDSSFTTMYNVVEGSEYRFEEDQVAHNLNVGVEDINQYTISIDGPSIIINYPEENEPSQHITKKFNVDLDQLIEHPELSIEGYYELSNMYYNSSFANGFDKKVFSNSDDYYKFYELVDNQYQLIQEQYLEDAWIIVGVTDLVVVHWNYMSNILTVENIDGSIFTYDDLRSNQFRIIGESLCLNVNNQIQLINLADLSIIESYQISNTGGAFFEHNDSFVDFIIVNDNANVSEVTYLTITEDNISARENTTLSGIGYMPFNTQLEDYHMFPVKTIFGPDIVSLYMESIDSYVSNDDSEQVLTSSNIDIRNYPNPFNPETIISFNNQIAGHISIDIYNVKGQLVKTLFNGFHNPGRHEIVWKGTDNNNNNVSSGVYFTKIKTKTTSETKKIMLMK
jgi:hypothetical protein